MRFDTRLELRMGFAAVVALLAALASGCAAVGSSGSDTSGGSAGGTNRGGSVGASVSGSDSLDGTAWVVSRLHGAAPEAPAAPTPTMRFEYGRVAGSDGCNRYSGGYRSEGNSFELLGNMVSTKRACPDAQMRTATAFMAALNRVRALRHEGSELQLLDSGGVPVIRAARARSPKG